MPFATVRRLSCNPSIEWMYCGSTVDSNGTWRESWYALEVVDHMPVCLPVCL